MKARTETARLVQAGHHAAIDVLTRAETFLASAAEDRAAPPIMPDTKALLEDFHRLVEVEIDLHFDFEEQVLFPTLEERGTAGLTALLVAEHASIRPLARAVQRLCTVILQQGFDDKSWVAFQGLGQALALRLTSHLAHEETALLDAVDAALDPTAAPGLDRRLAGMRLEARISATKSVLAG